MSHFTTVKTKISDRECLKKAIKDLGYNYKENKIDIKVDIFIKTTMAYNISCKWNGKTYDIVADWRMTGINRNDFISRLTQRYAYNKTKKTLQEKGFIVAEEKVNEKNEIVLTVRQW